MGKVATHDRTSLWLISLLVIVSPLIITFLVAALLVWVIRSVWLHVAIWCWWLPRGRDTLVVYSHSPVWQAHMEEEILPRLASRAVILNWSERKQWRFGLARAAFRHFGGRREFNPLAVVFLPFRRTRVFRFWRPFRDWKHGHGEALAQLEDELFAVLRIRKTDPAV